MSEQYLLRPSEAAQRLGVCRSTVYTLVADGEIPFVRLGRSIRIPAQRLREIIDGRITINAVNDPHRPVAA